MPLGRTSSFLIVEDSPTVTRMLRGMLRALGYPDVDEATSGNTALAASQARIYDAIISDWDMPNGTGLKLLQGLRADGRHRHAIFVMATAVTTAENIERAMQAGASAYLKKPYNIDALNDALNIAVQKHAAF